MKQKREKWGVIFDMDGVLIDSYKVHFISWKKALNKHGLDITEEQFSSTFGQTNVDILSKLFPFLSLNEMNTIAEEKEQVFRQLIKEDFPEMEGASELIESIHRAGGLLGLGSSGPLENIRTVLSLLPAGRYFQAVVSGSDISHGKPHPEVFLKTAEKLGISPSMCVVIEDAPAGVEAAKRAGCSAVGLVGTVSEDQLKGADMIVNSLKELDPRKLLTLICSKKVQS
jgi:beta-phosphoglucomutase family hydrolase